MGGVPPIGYSPVMKVPMISKQFAESLAALAPREMQVIKLAAQGWGNPMIADKLGLSIKTIENTMARAMKKFRPRITRGRLIVLWTESRRK